MDSTIIDCKSYDLLKILVAAGARLDGLALISAVERRAAKSAELLIRSGVDPNSLTNRGETALYFAINHGMTYIVKLLIEFGADVNLKYYGDLTSMKLAICSNQVEIAEMLIRAGFYIETRNKCGYTALAYAWHYNRDEIAKLLIKAGANPHNAGNDLLYKYAVKMGYVVNVNRKSNVRFDPITITAGTIGSRLRRKPNTKKVYTAKDAVEFLNEIKDGIPIIMQFDEDDKYEFKNTQSAIEWIDKNFLNKTR